MIIIIDLYGSLLAGDKRHALDIIEALGIRYNKAEPQPIADRWKFHGVDPTTVPPILPKYVRRIEEKKDEEIHEKEDD